MSEGQQVLEAPKSQEKELEEPIEEIKAGFLVRGVAGLIDAILLGVILLGIFLIFGSGLTLEGTFALSYFTSIIISLVYYTYFYSTTGQTLGKKILGLKVVSDDEEPLTFAIGIIRYIGYYVSAIVILIGFLMILFNKEKQGLHDKLAGTYVIKVNQEE